MDATWRNSVCKDSVVGQTRAPGRAMSRLAKSTIWLVLLVGLGSWSGGAYAVICTSTAAGGNWNAPATWTGCAGGNGPVANTPGSNDTAVIATAGASVVTANVVIVVGNVVINSGKLNVGGSNWTVNGTTTVNNTGTIDQTSTGGSATFIGLVTVNGGGTWANTANEAIVFRGGITNDGTFNGGTATQTFNTNSQAIGGAGPINFNGAVTVTGAITITNNNTSTVTIAGALNGSVAGSTWVNAVNSTLNYSNSGSTAAPMATGVLTANANSNTVIYSRGGNQTIKVPSGAPATYYHLTLSGSGIKTMPATAMTVTGNFTMSGAAATSATAAQALTVGGNFTLNALNTFTAGAFLHSVGGNWSNSGTFTAAAGAGTVTFNGTNSTLGGTVATTFNNLTINKTAGNNVSIVCGTPSPTVNATLTLTSGDIVTSGTSPACATDCASQVPVIVAAAGTITGGSSTSYVQGALRKMFNAAATLNFRAVAGQDEFPVGDATNYTPVEITTGTTSTAGSVTACVTPTDHPQVTTPIATTGIDAAKSVNRYWSLTTATINTTAVPVDATFKFVAGDVDGGAATANFIVEDYSGTYWSPTTLVTAAATSTRAQNIDLTSTTNDIAIGEPLFGFTPLPGQFNAFETTTPAGAVLGMVQTKQSGVALSVRLVRLNVAKNAVDTTYTQAGVTVELLDSSDNTGALNAATGCRPIGAAVGQWHPIAGTSQLVNFNLGVISPVNFTAADSYRDVRVHVVKTLVGAGEGCSTDRFAIRPASLTITAHDATWATAGTGRTLANTGASGGNVHKAATDLSPVPFTLRATPLPATATNYDGTPTTVAGFPACGTLCTTVGGLSFTAGSWTAAGSGVRENATANYSEAGTFNLQLEDATYASVDAVDGSSPAMRTVPATASVEIGRFVPDHFDVTGLITPVFKTFNAADAACSTGAAPRRTFTYIGQPFGYLTAPQATIAALNAAGSTTVNYSGTLWKIGGTSSFSKDCTTDPNICLFTTSWTGGGNSSSVAESYAYTLTPASTPGWDNASAATAAATVTPGAGTGTIAISSGNILAFLRNTTTPQAAFTANITDTISVTDASENAVANNGIISTATPLVFNGTGSGIDFDGGGASNGKEFRYGRLKLANAHGSELLDLPIPTQTQYWDATTSAFVTNSADNCTMLQSANIALVKTPVGCTTAVSGNVSFSSGLGDMKLTKPGAKCTADITANLAAEIPSKAYLQGKWSGVNYDQNPTARAIFGVYKGANEFIYMRENY